MKNFNGFLFLIFFFLSSANSENLNISAKISTAGESDQTVYFSGPGEADEWWYIIGGCNTSADVWVFPSEPGEADKWIYLSGPGGADKWICITNLEELDYEMLKILGLRR